MSSIRRGLADYIDNHHRRYLPSQESISQYMREYFQGANNSGYAAFRMLQPASIGFREVYATEAGREDILLANLKTFLASRLVYTDLAILDEAVLHFDRGNVTSSVWLSPVPSGFAESLRWPEIQAAVPGTSLSEAHRVMRHFMYHDLLSAGGRSMAPTDAGANYPRSVGYLLLLRSEGNWEARNNPAVTWGADNAVIGCVTWRSEDQPVEQQGGLQ